MISVPKFYLKSLLSSSFFPFTSESPPAYRKFILFLGPPGSGIGTYANLLCKDLQYNRISISDEIRKLVQGTSNLKIDAQKLRENTLVLTQGKIVTNDLALQIINEKLKEPASQKGVTIGGFPRNLIQTESYELKYPIHLVVYIRVDEDIIMETLLGRRSCIRCGLVYNLCEIHRNNYHMEKILPKNEGKCDNCNEKLTIRLDDNIQTIYSRIYNFRNEGLKLLQYFKSKKLVYEFEPKNGVKDYPELLVKVKEILKIKE